jgi:hypothetical protein
MVLRITFSPLRADSAMASTASPSKCGEANGLRQGSPTASHLSCTNRIAGGHRRSTKLPPSIDEPRRGWAEWALAMTASGEILPPHDVHAPTAA